VRWLGDLNKRQKGFSMKGRDKEKKKIESCPITGNRGPLTKGGQFRPPI